MMSRINYAVGGRHFKLSNLSSLWFKLWDEMLQHVSEQSRGPWWKRDNTIKDVI